MRADWWMAGCGASARFARLITHLRTRRSWVADHSCFPVRRRWPIIGVLFLDELAEFDRQTLDALRQPLEEGVLMIARAHGHVRYPARFQLVAAMNPCRCGYFGDLERPCMCKIGDPERYVQRVSGPLLDRIDMQIEMARVPPPQLLSGPTPESSESVRQRISAARAVALERNEGRPNARLTGPMLLDACALTRTAKSAVEDLATSQHLSARSTHRLMRVARTVADLEGHAEILEQDVNAAAMLRDPQTRLSSQLAA